MLGFCSVDIYNLYLFSVGMAVTTILKLVSRYSVGLIAVLLSGCGGDGESDIKTSNAEAGTLYVAVRAVNAYGQSSVPSEEVSANIQRGDDVQLSFKEPVRQSNGECLSVGIEQYVVEYGTQSGEYTDEVSIPRNSSELTCTATGVDSCNDINSCSINVTL